MPFCHRRKKIAAPKFNEKKIASRFNSSIDDVKTILFKLKQLEILEYQEQNDLARQKKEQAERERKRIEHERRKEREEEEALEQARRAMMIHTHKETASNVSNPQDSIATNKVPIGPSSGGSLHGGHDSPGNEESNADRARQQREQLRREEQERRRREANANRIDMNRQSDLMAAFEENII